MTERQITFDKAVAARDARYRALIQERLDDFARGNVIEGTDVKAWLDTLGCQEPV